jgi:type II secretory pathway pseudopilin PulG
MRWAKSQSSERGFSLVEVIFALTILMSVCLGVIQLFAMATQANLGAKWQTSTAILASQKMEQLRGLTWGYDNTGLGLPLSDTTSNLCYDPPTNSGSGLNPSPSGVMLTNTPGFVDFLDQYGRWVGTGSTPPPGAVFIRRWSIEPLPTNPNNTLVIQVMVTTVATEAQTNRAVQTSRWRLTNDAWIVSVKTRKAS